MGPFLTIPKLSRKLSCMRVIFVFVETEEGAECQVWNDWGWGCTLESRGARRAAPKLTGGFQLVLESPH